MLKRVVLSVLVAALAFSAGGVRAGEDVPKLKVLLIVGGCCHDYTKQKEILATGLQERAHCEVTVVQQGGAALDVKIPVYEKADWAKDYDVVIHDECFANVKDVEWVNNILKPHAEGKPAVLLHCAMHCYRTGTDIWFKFCGIQSSSHGPQVPIEQTIVDKEHPITKGTEGWKTINEELYNNIKVFDTAHPLTKGKQVIKDKEGKEKEVEWVVTWTNQYEKGRVFATTIGHNNATVADPRYLDMVTRGLLWSCDKLNDKYLKTPAK